LHINTPCVESGTLVAGSFSSSSFETNILLESSSVLTCIEKRKAQGGHTLRLLFSSRSVINARADDAALVRSWVFIPLALMTMIHAARSEADNIHHWCIDPRSAPHLKHRHGLLFGL
jgi:hypothetical protein